MYTIFVAGKTECHTEKHKVRQIEEPQLVN